MLRCSDIFDQRRHGAASHFGVICPPKPLAGTAPAPDVVRTFPPLLRRDVRGLPDLQAAVASAGIADRHAPGARLHRAARLRPRPLLPFPPPHSPAPPPV